MVKGYIAAISIFFLSSLSFSREGFYWESEAYWNSQTRGEDGIPIVSLGAEEQLYNLVFKDMYNTTSAGEAESYKPLRKNIDRLVNDLTELHFSKGNKEHPAFFIMLGTGNSLEEDCRGLMQVRKMPYILRWNEGKQKYEEAYTLPVQKDIIVIHDPERFSVVNRDRDRNGNWIEQRYHLLGAGFNGATNGKLALKDHEWQKGKPMAKSALLRYIRHDGTNLENDSRNESILQFPILRFPKEYRRRENGFIEKLEDGRTRLLPPIGSRDTFPVKFIVIEGYTLIGNITTPDGRQYPLKEYDPSINGSYSIPVDGYNVRDCLESSIGMTTTIIKPPGN